LAWSTARKDPAYNTTEWRRARDACLRAARWKCEIRVTGVCIGAASQADHVEQLANDPHHRNLRAACRPCHAWVTARQGNEAKRIASGHAPAPDPAPRPRTRWDDEDLPPF
jgi:hypothetical protein